MGQALVPANTAATSGAAAKNVSSTLEKEINQLVTAFQFDNSNISRLELGILSSIKIL